MYQTISDRNKNFNFLLKGLFDFFKHDAVGMYKLLKQKGVSDREIAQTLGVDRRVIGRKYAGLKDISQVIKYTKKGGRNA